MCATLPACARANARGAPPLRARTTFLDRSVTHLKRGSAPRRAQDEQCWLPTVTSALTERRTIHSVMTDDNDAAPDQVRAQPLKPRPSSRVQPCSRLALPTTTHPHVGDVTRVAIHGPAGGRMDGEAGACVPSEVSGAIRHGPTVGVSARLAVARGAATGYAPVVT